LKDYELRDNVQCSSLESQILLKEASLEDTKKAKFTFNFMSNLSGVKSGPSHQLH
jgi:hypothetical protein